MKKLSFLISIVLLVCLGITTSMAFAGGLPRKAFGKDHPFSSEELPAGKLKTKLQSLSPKAKDKAMKWLHTFDFDATDAAKSLRADNDGGIFYVCPDSQGNDIGQTSGPSQPEKIAVKSSSIANSTPAPDQTTEPPPVAYAAVPISSPPVYHSRPGSTKHIYLDFNGGIVTGTAWNSSAGVASYNVKPFSLDADSTTFSDAEQTEIKRIWERISEDYAPFDVDVTTDVAYDPDNYTGDKNKVGWIMIAPTIDNNGVALPDDTYGGVAYVGVFGNSNYHTTYQPAWVSSTNGGGREDIISEAASHEMGHNMGLSHDGLAVNGTKTAEYYGGHGTGEISWGPIMGTGYNRNVSQWSKGEYYNANQPQDDLAIISARLSYRADDHGNTAGTATPLTITNKTTITSTTPETDPTNSNPANKGVIETNTDVDVFSFQTGAGNVQLNVNPWKEAADTNGGNLDVSIELHDDQGQVIASNNSSSVTYASISATLPAGTYFLYVTNSGTGDPFSSTPTGYTTYGSIGQYFISGTIVDTTPNLLITPAGDLAASGIAGGPFSPSSQIYTLQNTGTTSLNWTAGKSAAWVTLSTTSGSLAPGDSATVTVTINNAASSLAIGSYSDTVSFTNTTTGNGNTTRNASLSVTAIPATVTLVNLNQTYDGSPKPVTVTTNPPSLAYSVTYTPSGVPVNAGTYLVTATITDPNYAGSASGSLVIAKAPQSITFDTLAPVNDTTTPFTLGATADSGLAISYASSNTSVATVSGNTVTIVGAGTTTITASQAGSVNYNAATDVPQTLTVTRLNPLAVPGGPYKVLVNQNLALDGSASLPSGVATITAYDWDLNNDGIFGDVTGATPSAISFATLSSTWGMAQGLNTVKLKITDSAGKTSIVSTTVELVLSLTWDANGATAGQTNGAGAWLSASKWWDGATNQTWASGSNATFGGPSTAGGAVTLASPTSVNAITFNTFTGTYTLGTAGQALTINGGINQTSASATVVIASPVTLGSAQTWTNNSSGANTLSIGTQAAGVTVDNSGNLLTVDGTGSTFIKWGVISGNGGLTKNDVGFLEIGGQYSAVSHTYTGTTTLNGGVMRVNGDTGSLGNLGSGNLTLNGGVLEYYFGGTFIRTLGSGVGQVQILGGASGFGCGSAVTFTLNNSAAYEAVWGSTYFNPSTLVLNAATSGGTTTLANKLDLNGATRTIQVSGGTAIISGIIRTSTGTAGLIKTGSATLALSAANTYNGDTTISGGTLQIGNATAGSLGSSGIYNANISIASGASLKIFSTANQTLGGSISGSGSLVKAYAGTLTLSNTNTYTGKTSITPQTTAGAGTVNVSSFNSVTTNAGLGTVHSASSSLGAPTTLANGTIDFGSTAAQGAVTLKYTGNGETTDRVINFLFNGTGATKTLDTSGAGLLKFTSAFTGSGSTTNDITLQGSSNGEIVGGLPFVFRNFTKLGNNTWTLDGTCLYTGTTTITAGKLALGANNVLPDATAVSIGAATLDAVTFSDTLGTLDVTAAAVINLGAGAALAFADSSAVDWTGGTLNITGTFVPGSSLRFGTSSTGLTSTQLTKISAAGYSNFFLDANGYLTVDITPPTLASSAIVDDKGGAPITPNTLVTYTVSFSEDMNASTVTAASFGNAGSAIVTIGSVTETSPTSGIFIVQATPISAGTLQLKVNAGAVLKDVAGNNLNTTSAILDDTTLAVDGTPPTLTSSAIVDDKNGAPITPNTLVTYTVIFSEDMNASTVTAASFGNAGSATVTIGSVTETSPTSGVFIVQATPTNAGTLQLKVNAGAILKDVAGNNLDTTIAIVDNTTLTVDGTPPTLASSAIVDDKNGAPITPNTLVTYTVTFSEDMNASTVTAASFGNAGSATVTIGSVTETSPTSGVFTVQATPTSAGTLQLKVNAGAVLKDVAGNNLDTTSAIADNTTITVDGTAPTLAASSIVDDKSGAPITVNTLVTYTVTFSEDMDATSVSAADFGNAGTSTVTFGAVTETSPTSGVFTVQATPTTAGTLQLKVNAGAVLKDVAGNNLDTTSAILDDTTLTVQTPYASWVGGGAAYTADANNDGVANGLAWVLGAANPAANATALLPTFDNTTDPNYFIYTYRRSDAANTDVKTTIAAQYSSDLGTWTTAVHDGTNIIITPTDNFYGTNPGIDKVEVKIKRTLAVGSKLFVRLNVVIAP